MYSLKQKFSQFSLFTGRANFYKMTSRFFTEVTTKDSDSQPSVKKPDTKDFSDLTAEQYNSALKVGADLSLSPENLKEIETVGFSFTDKNPTFDLNKITQAASKGYFHQYLKNLLLLTDYNHCFRTFLQAIAMQKAEGLELVSEPRLNMYLLSNLHLIRTKGFNVEFSDLRILQDFKVLRVELYKNLSIDRFENQSYEKYTFATYPTPIGRCKSATLMGEEKSYFHNNFPYTLATTMHVRSPMKLQIFNQNLSKKLHGGENKEVLDYVVRFETKMNINDFAWVLPTQNKPKRVRQTKITDFNNVLRGNPYFPENFDLIGTQKDRWNYMQEGEDKDMEVAEILKKLNEFNTLF